MSQSKETPSQQVKRLERELEDERIRTLVLTEMVAIMEKETGRALTKKPLAKELENYRPKVK